MINEEDTSHNAKNLTMIDLIITSQARFKSSQYFHLYQLTLLRRLTLVMVFCWSPECFTSKAIRRTKASKVWKHFART